MNICFPCDPLYPTRVDSEFIDDAHAFAQLGLGISVWSMDEPNTPVRGTKHYPHHEGAPNAWRGWMLSPADYALWIAALGNEQALVSQDDYELHHCMRGWAYAFKEFTPDTWFVPEVKDIQPWMLPCHVKDGVKSANASYLPRPCRSVSDVAQHVRELIRQRGTLEDGLVLRQHYDTDESFGEVRVWVFGRTTFLYYADAKLDAWLTKVLSQPHDTFFGSPFTMDIARTKDGRYFVMDVGDAGVSDYKEGWRSESFLEALREMWVTRLSSGLLLPRMLSKTEDV